MNVVDSPEPVATEVGLPLVAIVGRPNVGKSTLLNRIIGRREAIVEERPGVTRDRKEVRAEWSGHRFRLVDTGGWLPGGDALDEKVSRQSERAMEEADLILLVVDVVIGVTEEDDRVAELLRRKGRPVMVVVNKVDSSLRNGDAWEFVRLGLGDPYPVSAVHGLGTGDLLDGLVERLVAAGALRSHAEVEAELAETGPVEGLAARSAREAAAAEDEAAEGAFAVAIVGRPNVGKSTLFNRLIGEERSVVHDLAGTTRDTVDTVVVTDSGAVRFVDTAGMRRRSRVDEATEYYSVLRAMRAVDTADVALLVIDATDGVTHQDQRLAERVDGAGCPIVVLLNKWDLVDDAEDRADVMREVERRLAFVGDATVLKISAQSGKGVHKLMPALGEAITGYHTRVPTAALNRALREAQQRQPAPGGARVLYATQGATDPPTFTLFANREIPATYLRYLERTIREGFSLGATPLKLRVRRR
ncbi:MAG: ribosome biogenesis GTPase Der [Actinomycetota bacterium]|nr:ribosome biogenesis GTPase Der [Actinomycetota bacterium]